MHFHSNLHNQSTSFLPWIALTLLTALWGVVPSAQAQTAHFSGAVVTLGSGFSTPTAVAIDGSGNVFVADDSNNAVYEILAAGDYTTVNTLGSGFSQPRGVAVDGTGNVFVADTANNEVKKILAASGYITANILGFAFNRPMGVAVDGSGNVFVADTANSAVKEILAAGGYTTVNTLASGFSNPTGVAVDASGNVFVADEGHSAVKEILAAGGYTTVNTLGSGFNSAQGVALDGSGNVYVADTGHGRVKEILAAGGYTTVNTLGSGFSQPRGVAVDGTGNVFVADTGLGGVREILAAANFGPVNVGTSSPSPTSVVFTFDTGGTLVSTAVLTLGAAGLDFTDAGTGTCKALTAYNAGDTCTVDVIFKPGVPGPRYGAAELLGVSGNLLATGYVQGTGMGPQVNFLPGVQSTLGYTLTYPEGVAVDGSGNVYVADYGNNAVKEILAAGGYTTINTLGSGFSGPTGVAVDGSGNVFVADSGNNAVKEILAAGGYTTIDTLGGFELQAPGGVAVDGSGNVFVADSLNDAVKEIVAAGGYTTINTLGSGFYYPFGVAVDGNGNVFVADTGNSTVKEILAVGGYTTVNTLGSGFNYPYGVAVGASGNVFVADQDNSAVKEIRAPGGYTTVNTLGSGFSYPFGVAVDGSGNLFVTDSGNNRVERLDYSDPPSLNFSSTLVGSISSDSPQAVTVENIGNATLLTVTAYTFPADFNQVTGSGIPVDCKRSFFLFAGASCNLRIEFAPQTEGTLNESLVLKDNSLNATAATQGISLSGTGATVPAASLSASSLSFGSVDIGTSGGSQSVTLTNTGTLALSITSIAVTGTNASSFVFGNSCGSSLAGGANCNIHGHFAPTASGPLTAAITFTDNAGNSPQSIALSGTGVAAPVVKVSAMSLAFGSANFGSTTASQTVTLTNTGSAALSITSINVIGTNASSFVFANSCGSSLAAGANCTIHGHFGPLASGALTAAITITDNAAGSPQSISLSGTGIAAPVVSLSTNNLSFGSANVGAISGSQTVTLTNAGDAALSIASISVTGTNASSFVFANSCGSTLAAGANCTIHGHFGPLTSGALNAAITITDNSGSPQSITLSGTGVAAPVVSLSANKLSFGTVKMGAMSGSQTVTLTNTGDAALTISSVNVTGANASSFVFANSCGTTLSAGANCIIHGHFAPITTGALTASISITDNAAGSPQSIALTGTGQ